MKPPAPPRVDDHYRYWTTPPPKLSDRCRFWTDRIKAGWRPSKHVGSYGYDSMAAYLGVYIYEYLEIISPMLREPRPASQRQSDGHEKGNGT